MFKTLGTLMWLTLLVPMTAHGATARAPGGTSSAHVLNIEPVNDVIWGANVLVFSIDVAVDFQTDTSWDCVSASGQQRHSVQWFAIPKANPAVGSSGDNPMYRDYANYVTLSLVTGKPIFMYVDTCVAGYPRVIFMNINN